MEFVMILYIIVTFAILKISFPILITTDIFFMWCDTLFVVLSSLFILSMACANFVSGPLVSSANFISLSIVLLHVCRKEMAQSRPGQLFAKFEMVMFSFFQHSLCHVLAVPLLLLALVPTGHLLFQLTELFGLHHLRVLFIEFATEHTNLDVINL